MQLPDVQQSKVTADGWRLSVSLTGMSISAVPSMAATAFTGEAFVTGTATLTIDATGPDMDRNDLQLRALSFWAELGCQFDLSAGGNVHGNNDIGSRDTASAKNTADTGITVTPEVHIEHDTRHITGTVLGYRVFNKLMEASLSSAQAKKVMDGLKTSVQDFHIQKDGCGGPVGVRLHAKAWLQTANSDDAVDAYSDITPL